MELSPKAVLKALKNKGVESVHHANSVITACTFLRTGSLLSRGVVANEGLYQTPQDSDETDKAYGVWFDIFVDSADNHHRAKRSNVYGPVLFVLDPELMSQECSGNVWVTKLNPTKWAGLEHSDKWFSTARELSRDFVFGRFDQMIVFRHCGGRIPLSPYLKEIILDDPRRKTLGGIDYYSMAYGALTLAKSQGGIDVKITRRVCPTECKCFNQYRTSAKTRSMFWPEET